MSARLLAAVLWPLAVLLAVLPRRALMALGSVLGGLWFYGVPVRRRWVLAHLEAVQPPLVSSVAERRRVARSVLVAQSRNVLELVALRGGARAPLVVDGAHWLEAARGARRGVLVVSAHCGNFDVAACRYAQLHAERVYVVSKRLSWRALDAVWMATRARHGVHALAPGDEASGALRVLREGGVVVMVLDQHSPEPRALEAPFLGIEARTSLAAAMLALRSGAAVVPCFASRERDGVHRLRFEPPLEVPQGGSPRARAQALTVLALARVEAAVRADPAGWLWLHRRWKTRDGRPRVLPSRATGRTLARQGGLAGASAPARDVESD